MKMHWNRWNLHMRTSRLRYCCLPWHFCGLDLLVQFSLFTLPYDLEKFVGWKTEEISRCWASLSEREGLWSWKWDYVEVPRSGFCSGGEGRSSIICFSRNFKPKGRNLGENVSFVYSFCHAFNNSVWCLIYSFLVVPKLQPWRFTFLLWRKIWRKNISDGVLHRLIMKDR